MRQAELGAIARRLRDAKRVLVTSHVSPDGDAVGAMLAVYHIIRQMHENDVACVLADPVPKRYAWLPGVERIQLPEACEGPFDLAVVVDVAQLDRVGDAARLIGDDTHVVILDHHLEKDPDADTAVVDADYAATGELVVELMDAAEVPLTPEIAACAYVALTTDTGSFKYSNTTERSHMIAARLVATGLPVAEIARKVFDETSPGRFRLMVRFVNSIELLEGGRIALGGVSAGDIEKAGALEEDTEGLINYARNIEGVHVAMFFREVDEGTVKLSLRSREGINSAAILAPLGGGGHAAAAGVTLEMSLEEARSAALKRVREAIAQQP